MKKKYISLFLAACLIAALLPSAVHAASDSTAEPSFLPEDYSNPVSRFYPDIFGSRSTSFLGTLPQGGYQAVFHHDGTLYITDYDDSWNVLESRTLELELPLWGGVFLGEQFNYVVCGQRRNAAEFDGGETYRIIKYDKAFQRLGSVSLTSGSTYTHLPFDSGNVSMAECGNILTLYTSRQMPDGHQSNLELHINTDDMTIRDRIITDDAPATYVSHSFRQIVKYDGDLPVYVDLADAYPVRSVYIQFGPNQFPLMPIDGETGENVTNTEVSGLAISDEYYFVVGSYENQEKNNIFLIRIDKQASQIKFSWLTDATLFTGEYVAYPKITRIGEDRFVIMWNHDTENSVHYVIMDQNGDIISEEKEVGGVHLTDCEPLYADGKILWLSVQSGAVSLQQITDLSASGTFEWDPGLVEGENPWDGSADISWYRSEQTHFTISTPQQLAGLSELAAAGTTFAGQTVSLANDLFMNTLSFDHEWTPIANWEGTFNGNGHTIYNISRQDSEVHGGLFHTVGPNGRVNAITLSQGIFHAGGSVAHINEGIISFCTNNSMVYGLEYIDSGAICNTNLNLVYGCKNYGNVFGYSIAGIVGYNNSILSVVNQCSNHGFVGGIHRAAGILRYNLGWIYNCYSRGLVSAVVPGVYNEASVLSGIVTSVNSGGSVGDVESCYHAGTLQLPINESSCLVYDVAPSEIVNCYALDDWNHSSGEMTWMTPEQMTAPEFVELLNRQTNTVFPAWLADRDGCNGGFPITLADANAQKGIYKIQPELWMNWQGTLTMHKGYRQSCGLDCYYNESDLKLIVDDASILDYTISNTIASLSPKATGTTQVRFRFDETEHTCETEYVLNVVVEPHIWSEWTVVQAPSDTSDGLESRYCTVCRETESRSLRDPGNPFSDVPKGAFYYDSVLWAVEKNITSGITDTTFCPKQDCTRGQVVTFLWRAAGSPEPKTTSHPFTDVKEGAYYYKAMLWAVENNITKGTTATTFGPKDVCNRGTVVTFLHRAMGCPAPKSTEHPFTDVKEGKFYYNAMLWAVENEITSGISKTLFAPNGSCTRGQVVTFLYRAYAK